MADCLSYNKADFTQNLECNACGSNFYLSNNSCPAHNFNNVGCDTASSTANACQTCQSGYFVENGICHVNPDGIQNCIDYDASGNCLSCDVNFYLDGVDCLVVNPTILKCLYYSDAITCSQCDLNFFLNGNQCDAMVA
ncbi:MAG: hypothetical protein GY938_03030 [Ketobacter sp.]|nr:hypothetical protein [Ketobacter sp.]